MLNVQSYLTTSGLSPEKALQQLKENHGINFRLYEDRVLLKYSQFGADKSCKMVQECRGIILALPDFSIMSRSFDRFFNLGEMPEETSAVDFSTSVCFEKVDGSLINLYYDGSSWCLATSGTAHAECDNYTGQVFSDMVKKAFGISCLQAAMSYSWSLQENTYIFEFKSPCNRVVTPYTSEEMVLLAVRNKHTGEYLTDLSKAGSIGGFRYRLPKTFNLDTPTQVKEAADSLEGLQEGFVVFDTVSQARVKIKSLKYVTAHAMKGEGQLSPKRSAALVYNGDMEEYLTYFPEYTETLYGMFNSHMIMLLNISTDYITAKLATNSIKDFANAVKNLHGANLMFVARSGEYSIQEAFHNLKINQKVKMLLQFKELSKEGTVD